MERWELTVQHPEAESMGVRFEADTRLGVVDLFYGWLRKNENEGLLIYIGTYDV